jgi:calcium-dependent protein kinase
VSRERQGRVRQEQFIRVKKSDIHRDYELHERLGAGAFGEVFRCVGRRTREERAVKVLKRNIFSNPRVKEQFLQEFTVLKRTSHPNVLRIFEIYHHDSFMYIISELCAGGTLADLLKRIPRPGQQLTQEILVQLFRGVNYLHTLNILHRDIKPENLAFTRELHEHSTTEEVDLRIIDFGLAIEGQEKVFKDWAKIGTVSYMAPEVFNGVYSIKCDSWSCGVVMYQLIAGGNPFKSINSL